MLNNCMIALCLCFRNPPQKLFHFPSNDSQDEIMMSHDSGEVTSHDSGVERSCDIDRSKGLTMQHEVNYTKVYFDDANTKRYALCRR